jgi:hypothetical protein
MSDQDKSPELYGGHEPAPSTSGPTSHRRRPDRFLHHRTDTLHPAQHGREPGPGAIDFEEATIRVTGVHNVDASFFVL